MSKRYRKGRGGQRVTLCVDGLPASFTERDVKAMLMHRGAGHVAAILLCPTSDASTRSARVLLAWRAAQKVMAAPPPHPPVTIRLLASGNHLGQDHLGEG